MDVDDPVRKTVEERRRQQVHVPRQHDDLDAVLLEPGRHHEVALLARVVAVERERRSRDARGPGPLERARLLPVRRHRPDRQPGVDQRLEVRPLAADEHADHSMRPITRWPAASGTTAQYPIPRLKTRRSSSSATCRAEPIEDGRPLPRVPVDHGPQAVRHHTREVPLDPAAGHVGERAHLRLAAQRPHVLQIEARRREQVVALVVLGLEHPADEREPVRVHACRREADDEIAGRHPRPVDQRRAVDEPDAARGEVELAPRGRRPASPPSRRRSARTLRRGTPPRRPRPAPRPARDRAGSRRRSRAGTADRLRWSRRR